MPIHRTCATVIVLGLLCPLGACASPSSTSPVPTTVPAPTPTTGRSAPTTTTAADDPVARWTEDMVALGAGLRRIHPNPFWRQSEADFDASLAAAPPRLAALGVDDARAEVMRLTAGIDGHTGVYLGEAGFHLYTLHLYAFGDEMAVIASPDPALFGARVLSIDGVPTAEAARAVTPYSPFDNAATITLVVPTLLTTPEVLHAAGVIHDVAAPHYRLLLTDGTERTVEPDRLSWDEFTARDPRPIGMTKLASVPALARIDEPFWTTTLDGASLYLQYNEVVGMSGTTSIEQLARNLDTTLASGTLNRLVIDLRYNPGGNDRTYPPLLQVLSTHPALSHPGALVVLIGRQTFSAAALFATELDAHTGAVFVGEPTGGGPNIYANPRRLELPNSKIVVEVSSASFEVGGADDHRDTISPDIAVTASLDDLLAGRDPVLDAALAVP